MAVTALTAAAMLIAACSDDGPEEAVPTKDVSAGICAEGASDCDDTPDGSDQPDPDDGTAAPASTTCTDAESCQEQVTEIARRDLASALGIDVDAIVVVSAEAVAWPDACLGAAEPGTVCAQVITPGFKIVLKSGGEQYEYHTDEGSRAVLVP